MSLGRFRPGAVPAMLLFLALAVRVATALPLTQPGYMDSYYYTNVAARLYAGQGLTDPYLWNFLDHPVGIPHPACLYWMPLSSLLIYPFFLLLGPSFRAAQIPFIMLSAVLALLAYRLAMDLSDPHSGRRNGVLAALLVIFSGYYTIFWVVPDNFAPFAVTAGLSLYFCGRGLKQGQSLWFVPAGLTAGLAHLARADGLLVLLVVWAVAVIGALITNSGEGGATSSRRLSFAGAGLALLSYLAITAPWFYRNWAVSGHPLASGGLQALFLRSYDDLFSYGRDLAAASYLSWGWTAILSSKLQGLSFGLINLVAVNGMIFVAPLSAVGLWALRRRIELLPFVLYALLLYAAMTIGFTFPGMRGGLFHSSAALLPWLFAAAAVGLERIAALVSRRALFRHPSRFQSQTDVSPDAGRPSPPAVGDPGAVLAAGVVILAVVISGFLYLRGGISLTGGAGATMTWNRRDAVYADVGSWLAHRESGGERVMANNIPGFYYHTGLSGTSIPTEELPVVLEAARHYEIDYLVLEADHPQPLRALYEGPDVPAGLVWMATLQDSAGRLVKIFRIARGDS
jgi:hypothetical protein